MKWKGELHRIPFEASHLIGYELNGQVDPEHVRQLEQFSAEAYTMTDDAGRTLVCYGGREIAPWCKEVWMITTVHVLRWPVEAVSIGIEYIEKLLETYHRVQSVVLKSWITANEYVKKLGFEFEGTMRMMDEKGRDYNLYSRVV